MNEEPDRDDPFDTELSRALGALAPDSRSGDDAYVRALPGFVRARKRYRLVTITAAIALAIAAIVGLVLTSGVPGSNGGRAGGSVVVTGGNRTITFRPEPPTASATVRCQWRTGRSSSISGAWCSRLPSTRSTSTNAPSVCPSGSSVRS